MTLILFKPWNTMEETYFSNSGKMMILIKKRIIINLISNVLQDIKIFIFFLRIFFSLIRVVLNPFWNKPNKFTEFNMLCSVHIGTRVILISNKIHCHWILSRVSALNFSFPWKKSSRRLVNCSNIDINIDSKSFSNLISIKSIYPF